MSPFCVELVMQSIEVTPLPNAPRVVDGVINMRGNVIPVINLRRRLGMAERETSLADKFVIINTALRTVCVIVDDANPVVEFDQNDITPPDDVMPGLTGVTGIVCAADGMIIINDIDKFLSVEEGAAVDAALKDM